MTSLLVLDVVGLTPRLLARISAPPSLRDLTGSGYRFPPRLRRFLEARDRTCVFPGCGRPANKTDKDHGVPWPHGRTSAKNGQCLCRHHHRASRRQGSRASTIRSVSLWMLLRVISPVC